MDGTVLIQNKQMRNLEFWHMMARTAHVMSHHAPCRATFKNAGYCGALCWELGTTASILCLGHSHLVLHKFSLSLVLSAIEHRAQRISSDIFYLSSETVTRFGWPMLTNCKSAQSIQKSFHVCVCAAVRPDQQQKMQAFQQAS